MRLWRIATETRRYSALDLSGAGAALHPGRWNDEGEPVIYCAPTAAIAVLETAAHIDATGLPLNRFLVAIDVPEAVWERREILGVQDLSPLWSAIPAGRASVAIGSAFLRAQQSPILLVPSVVVPEEAVALINPIHPLCAGLKAEVIRPFEFNRLFRP